MPNTSGISNSPSGTTGAFNGILQVGPGKTYATVQDAVNAAVDGNTIEIYTSTYTQGAGWATINKNNLTLRGMGTRPVLDANGSCLSGKAIFIITGTGTTVENLEFKNSRNVTDKNAAGIRQEAANLTVRNCYFHDNDDGILCNAITGSAILVETSEFYHNGYGDGGSHNIYCNVVDSLTVRYCWSHGAVAGHEIKTRAKVNKILYNRIGNEGGTGSYEIDVPNGGTTYIIGNQIEQSSTAANPTIISYGAEGTTNPDQHLYVVNNTIVNNRTSGTFVYNYSTTTALLQNTIFQGAGTIVTGPNTQTTNWTTTNASLADPASYDFHLTAGSAGAINAGTTPGTGIDGFNMNPTLQYVHPDSSQARPAIGTIDIGAYEYVPPIPSVAVRYDQFQRRRVRHSRQPECLAEPVVQRHSYGAVRRHRRHRHGQRHGLHVVGWHTDVHVGSDDAARPGHRRQRYDGRGQRDDRCDPLKPEQRHARGQHDPHLYDQRQR